MKSRHRITARYAAEAIGVSVNTIHKWAREGRITRHPDGFDATDLMRAVEERDLDALLSRAGIKFADRPVTSDPADSFQ